SDRHAHRPAPARGRTPRAAVAGTFPGTPRRHHRAPRRRLPLRAAGRRTRLKIGLNIVPVATEKMVDAARLCEELGFEAVCIGEHIVLPMTLSKPYPYGEASFRPRTPFLEPFVALSHLAAATETLRLGTGICILPARSFF